MLLIPINLLIHIFRETHKLSFQKLDFLFQLFLIFDHNLNLLLTELKLITQVIIIFFELVIKMIEFIALFEFTLSCCWHHLSSNIILI